VPTGFAADSPQAAFEAARELGGRAVIKAQVLVGGRGKAGGVRIVASPEEALAAARDILSRRIKDIPVKKVLVAEVLEIRQEYYFGITVNRGERIVQCMVSAAGGIEIEETAAREPEKIHIVSADPFEGPDRREIETILRSLLPDRALAERAAAAMLRLYELFREKDCSLVEINPFALTAKGMLVAADAKIVFDDNALFKHPELEALRSDEEYSADEMEARAAGLSFVAMDGTVGCIVNGAGLAMATMDLIRLFGCRPANFLDVGGSSNPEKVVTALAILLRNRNIRSVFVNIFGGITRCDDIARGILMARDRLKLAVPLSIRLIGTNESEGRDLLAKAGIAVSREMTAAAKIAVELADRSAG
jgi:succinyl-CoA synthetase beta subunit